MSKVLRIAKDLFDIFYPIGSYYETSNANWTPQGAGWYGTLVEDSAGRVTVSKDSTQTEFNTIGETGGEKTHKLTEAEMPKHKHTSSKNFGYDSGTSGWGASFANYTSGYVYQSTNIGSYLNTAGNDQSHNNLQPYIVVRRWHRTA